MKIAICRLRAVGRAKKMIVIQRLRREAKESGES